MKRPFILLLALAAQLSLPTYCLSQLTSAPLIYTPQMRPTEKVEFYFPGEVLPTEPYTKFIVFEHTHILTYEQMLNGIRREAMKLGMDGVLMQQPMIIPGTSESYHHYLKLVGIGFKYDKNLDELVLKEKRLMVYKEQDIMFHHLSSLVYEAGKTEPRKTASTYLWEFPEKFSLGTLNAPKKGGDFEKKTDGVVTKRTYGESKTECEYMYTPEGQVQSIRFKNLGQWSGVMGFSYDAQGREIERRISDSPYGEVVIRTVYLPDGSVDKLLMIKIVNNAEVPLANIETMYINLRELVSK